MAVAPVHNRAAAKPVEQLVACNKDPAENQLAAKAADQVAAAKAEQLVELADQVARKADLAADLWAEPAEQLVADTVAQVEQLVAAKAANSPADIDL
jgi:hypothetical protein